MSSKQINEKIIRLTGSASFLREIDLGDDITLKVSATVVKTEDEDNQDGTKDVIYKAKIISVEEVEE